MRGEREKQLTGMSREEETQKIDGIQAEGVKVLNECVRVFRKPKLSYILKRGGLSHHSHLQQV